MSDIDVYKAPEADLLASPTISAEHVRHVLTLAKRQKTLIYIFLVYLLVGGVSGSVSAEVKPLLQLLLIPLMLMLIVFTARLTYKVYGIVVATIMTLFAIIPLINILVLLAVNGRTNRAISDSGFKVGFMGANVKEIESAYDNESKTS